MKRTISILTACFILAATAMPLSAEITFSQTAFAGAKERKAPPPKKERKAPPPKKHHHHDESDNIFAEILADLFFLFWFEENAMINYEDYPYEFDNSYLVYALQTDDETGELLPIEGTSINRFSVSSDLFYTTNLGYGINSEFESILVKFFGPVINNKTYIPFNSSRNEQSSDILCGKVDLGLRLSIFQTNPISMYCLWQYSYWYGDSIPYYIDNRHGLSFALEFKSYPVKPLVLNFTFKTLAPFNSNINYDECIFSAGYMFNRFELYATYNYSRGMYIGDVFTADDDFTYEHYNTISVGTRCYF